MSGIESREAAKARRDIEAAVPPRFQHLIGIGQRFAGQVGGVFVLSPVKIKSLRAFAASRETKKVGA